ncbi:tyrosine-type recombinase/integrase [Salmonella enterica]|nr:tyrosine-type recombinase/integrase [Salmonella enterica]EJF5922189.1 tyrosine-type recombinase/integrase [Salmonella enterica]EJF5944900.1 tyrosine-type recombinase/integrase [Salmonella enterica]EJH7819656.1 tyrosine-type recombinase/integrase [Salmonella enterica]EJW2053442.1 tyrosine-type recombinase/integrase [Salmonella enterica]
MSGRRFLTQHEISALLAAALDGPNPERNHCLILMAFLHGFRASELLALNVADLDLKGRIVYVSRLKNGFSTVHPLLPDELKTLRRWLRVRRTILTATGQDETRLFVSQKGRPLSRQQFYNILAVAGKRAALSLNPHPHMLRHACGYALADNGVDTRLIQDYLGHRNIRHTVRYTASNSARFEGIWRPARRRRGQQLESKCHPSHSMNTSYTHFYGTATLCNIFY